MYHITQNQITLPWDGVKSTTIPDGLVPWDGVKSTTSPDGLVPWDGVKSNGFACRKMAKRGPWREEDSCEGSTSQVEGNGQLRRKPRSGEREDGNATYRRRPVYQRTGQRRTEMDT